jgi:2-polyprenyl-6-methoxyphenol hydroxylase-like FAD-dependent oxidoreductase
MIYDVIIAGGGPVGLFLACELRLAGISVLVLEQLKDPHTALKVGAMGGRGLNLPSVEAFYRRGLLKPVRESSLAWMNAAANPGLPLNNPNRPQGTPGPRFAGHFAGIMLDATKIDFSNQPYVIPGPSVSGGIVSLEGLEDVLAERACELGAEIRYGVTVTGFTETADSVTVQTDTESIEAQWLVGCDGGRSTVRKRAGFDFEGTDPELTGWTAMADLADPEKLRPGFNLTPHGMYINGPASGRVGVLEFDRGVGDRTRAFTREQFQASLRRVSGTDVTVTVLHVGGSHTDVARQATTYRKGRILLAGDAAHVHSPMGGQGLNLGIGDAMNLGWKLAATLKGWAPDNLLDTYTAERHPIAAWALDWTRAQVAIMRPDPHARAIQHVVRDLMQTRDGANYFARRLSGLWLHYDFGSDLGGSHPLVGRSAPDFEFEDGTRLGDLLRGGNGLLLELSGDEQLRSLTRSLNSRLDYLSARASNTLGLRALLIRPDGFVAWATDADPSPAEAAASIARWFGEAA